METQQIEQQRRGPASWIDIQNKQTKCGSWFDMFGLVFQRGAPLRRPDPGLSAGDWNSEH